MTSKDTNTYDVASDDIANIYAEKAAGDFVRFPLAKVANSVSIAAGSIPVAIGANTLGTLAIGTNGQVLIVSGGAPAWGTATSGIVRLANTTFSGAATVDFASGFSSSYDAYLFVFIDVRPDTNNSYIFPVVSLDSGGVYGTSFSASVTMGYFSSGGLILSGTSQLGVSQGNTAANSMSGYMLFIPTTTHATFQGFTAFRSNTNEAAVFRSCGHATTASIANAVRFQANIGNMTGTIQLYGIKNT